MEPAPVDEAVDLRETLPQSSSNSGGVLEESRERPLNETRKRSLSLKTSDVSPFLADSVSDEAFRNRSLSSTLEEPLLNHERANSLFEWVQAQKQEKSSGEGGMKRTPSFLEFAELRESQSPGHSRTVSEYRSRQSSGTLSQHELEDFPLEHEWNIWFDLGAQKGSKLTDYQEQLHSLGTFSTILDFWRFWNNIGDVNALPDGSNIRVFKSTVRPVWEDPSNVNGGRWIIRSQDPDFITNLWTSIVLELIGEQFSHSDDICGIVLSMRSYGGSIVIWNKTSTDQKIIDEGTKHIREQFSGVLSQSLDVVYKPHQLGNQSKATNRADPRRSHYGQPYDATLPMGLEGSLSPRSYLDLPPGNIQSPPPYSYQNPFQSPKNHMKSPRSPKVDSRASGARDTASKGGHADRHERDDGEWAIVSPRGKHHGKQTKEAAGKSTPQSQSQSNQKLKPTSIAPASASSTPVKAPASVAPNKTSVLQNATGLNGAKVNTTPSANGHATEKSKSTPKQQVQQTPKDGQSANQTPSKTPQQNPWKIPPKPAAVPVLASSGQPKKSAVVVVEDDHTSENHFFFSEESQNKGNRADNAHPNQTPSKANPQNAAGTESSKPVAEEMSVVIKLKSRSSNNSPSRRISQRGNESKDTPTQKQADSTSTLPPPSNDSVESKDTDEDDLAANTDENNISEDTSLTPVGGKHQKKKLPTKQHKLHKTSVKEQTKPPRSDLLLNTILVAILAILFGVMYWWVATH